MATNDLIANMYEEPEVAGLARQRQLAQLLIQGGAQTPQSQMVNGMYVPVNPMERVGNMASLIMGLKSSENLDAKQSELAAALRQKEMGALQNYLKLKRGTPGQEGTPDFVQAGPMPDGGNIPIQYGQKAIAAVPGDTEAANLYAASNPYSKVLREMGVKGLTQDPKWEKYEMPDGRGGVKTGVINVNSPDPIATFKQGGTKMDYDYYKGVDEGYITPQGGQGMPMQGMAQQSAAPQGGVPLSVRNNNPGNMVGPDGQFRVFNSPQEGQAALLSDLQLKLSGQSPAYKARFGNQPVTPMTLAETWSPASAKGNSPESTANYSKFISQQLGIAPNQPIPNTPQALQTVASAISKFEAGAYGNQGNMQPVSAQSNVPQYEYNPSLTPKQNREEAAKFNAENQKAVKNVKNSFDILKASSELLNSNEPSSGRIENTLTGTKEMFGGGGKASQADAQLKILGGKLTSQVPRFEGPQSDKDTALYQAMAGDIGNANIPIATRLASLKQMIEITKKYYPEGNWDSIDTAGPVVKKNFLGGTNSLGAFVGSPEQFAEGLNAEDKAAFDFARKNPRDPRAIKIKQHLGIE